MYTGPGLLDHLVVPVNGSESSLAAFEHGLHLVGASRGTLEAVIVQDTTVPAIMSYVDAQTLARFVSESQRILETCADELHARMNNLARQRGVAATVTRTSGRFLEQLLEAVAPASFVIIGRGQHWQEGGLLGSNTELIVRQIRKPIMLAPKAFRPPTSLLVAYAAKNLGSLVLATGRTLAEALELPIEVLTVDDDPARREQVHARARQELDGITVETRYTGESGSPVERIAERCSKDTLLVVGAYGHSRVYRLLMGSVTARVMRRARGPVVITAKLD